MHVGIVSQIEESFAGELEHYQAWLKKTGKTDVNFHDYLKYSGRLDKATDVWSEIVEEDVPSQFINVPDKLKPMLKEYQDWVEKTGKTTTSFENYVRVNDSSLLPLLKGLDVNEILGNITEDSKAISQNRYLNYNEKSENQFWFQTQDGEVLVLDALTGKASSVEEPDIAEVFGIDKSAYDSMDFGQNELTISEYAFTGMADGADRHEIESLHYVYEELDPINNEYRVNQIIEEYSKDRNGIADLRDIFGNEYGSDNNVIYSQDGLSMSVVQNNNAVAINYNNEEKEATFINLNELALKSINPQTQIFEGFEIGDDNKLNVLIENTNATSNSSRIQNMIKNFF
jgi:hypothetical protein